MSCTLHNDKITQLCFLWFDNILELYSSSVTHLFLSWIWLFVVKAFGFVMNDGMCLICCMMTVFLQVGMIDTLPEVYPKVEGWVENVIMEEGNATILALFVCLLTVLYLRERRRRRVAVGDVPPHQQPGAPQLNWILPKRYCCLAHVKKKGGTWVFWRLILLQENV